MDILICARAQAPQQLKNSASLSFQTTLAIYWKLFLKVQNFSNNRMSSFPKHYKVKQTKKYHNAKQVSTPDSALLFPVKTPWNSER